MALVYHIDEMKTTILFFVALLVLLFSNLARIDWLSWLDGVAMGVAIVSLIHQMKERLGK